LSGNESEEWEEEEEEEEMAEEGKKLWSSWGKRDRWLRSLNSSNYIGEVALALNIFRGCCESYGLLSTSKKNRRRRGTRSPNKQRRRGYSG